MHISSGKLRIPVYVPKKRTEFYIEHETPRDLRMGTTNNVVIPLRKKTKKYFAWCDIIVVFGGSQF